MVIVLPLKFVPAIDLAYLVKNGFASPATGDSKAKASSVAGFSGSKDGVVSGCGGAHFSRRKPKETQQKAGKQRHPETLPQPQTATLTHFFALHLTPK